MLYEAAVYFVVFCVLFVAYWKTAIIQFPGRVFGTTLATCFLARFMIEFVKENQVPFENRMPLNMGQLMSIPFILTGVYLIYASRRMPRTDDAPKVEIFLADDRRYLGCGPKTTCARFSTFSHFANAAWISAAVNAA